MKKKIAAFFIVLLLIAGFGILAYPTISNQWNTYRQSRLISDYDAAVETKRNTVTTTYKYDGVEFHVDVEADAVQTHNAQDAIKSAWGADASAFGIL